MTDNVDSGMPSPAEVRPHAASMPEALRKIHADSIGENLIKDLSDRFLFAGGFFSNNPERPSMTIAWGNDRTALHGVNLRSLPDGNVVISHTDVSQGAANQANEEIWQILEVEKEHFAEFHQDRISKEELAVFLGDATRAARGILRIPTLDNKTKAMVGGNLWTQ